jgi:uncharacterized protein YqeY
MTTTALTPIHLVASTSLADLGAAVASSTIEKRTVRVANIGSVQAKADLVKTDGSTVIYLAKDLLITLNDDGSVVDLVIDDYLPRQLNEDELANVVDTALAQVAEEIGQRPGTKQMGQVMKAAMAIAEGKADSSRLSAAVKDRL